jgi:hypothetical protein
MLVELDLDIADAPEAPQWHPGQPEARAQLRTRAEGR